MERDQYHQSSSRPYPGRERKRLTRWGPETSNSPTSTYGFSTALPGSMTGEQKDAYVTAFRIEEITQKLRANDDELLISVDNGGRGRPRSPSPAPQYDSSGRRTNTRARRYRERLERERHRLVQVAAETIPWYRAPRDYRRPVTSKIQDRVYLPVADFPHVNFIGQILGPRGSSLKAMNSETGATIVIRGRGSVKEGKRRGNQAAQEREQEPLHCLVTADSQHKVNHAKNLIRDVIEGAISMPDELNARKNAQLRGLAMANGTFRDDESRSRGGGRPGGLIEHVSRSDTDGPQANRLGSGAGGYTNEHDLDREYEKLMAEVGGGSAAYGAGGSGEACQITKGPTPSNHPARSLYPWRSDPSRQ